MKTKEQIKRARAMVIEKYSAYLKANEKLEKRGKFNDNSLNEKMKTAKNKWEAQESKWHKIILESVVEESKKKEKQNNKKENS